MRPGVIVCVNEYESYCVGGWKTVWVVECEGGCNLGGQCYELQ